MNVICEHCGKTVSKDPNAINRARRRGMRLFCDKVCFGLGSRVNKSKEQLREEKRIYDMEYRSKNKSMLKTKKAAYFQRTYDPKKAAIERKKNMRRHVEYCRQPKYREYKKKYDSEYRAKLLGGEFWESYLLILELDKELDEKMSWYDRQMDKGTLNKANQRRKTYERESSRR